MGTTLAVLKRLVEDAPRSIQEVIPEVRLQAKRPEDRFASAREVAGLLERCEAEMHGQG